MCTLMSTHAYTSSEVEDTPSLIVHNAPEHFNPINVITKTIVVLPTRALTDTGALQEAMQLPESETTFCKKVVGYLKVA